MVLFGGKCGQCRRYGVGDLLMGAGFNFKRRQRQLTFPPLEEEPMKQPTFLHITDTLPKHFYDLEFQKRRKKLKPVERETIFKDPEPIEEQFHSYIESTKPVEEPIHEVVEPQPPTKGHSNKSRRRKSD